jgi:hypothetical protein
MEALNGEVDPIQALKQAEAAARKAVELDDNVATSEPAAVATLWGLISASGGSSAWDSIRSARLPSLTSTWSDPAHPPNLLSVQTYNPIGITNWTLGNGWSLAKTYDRRTRVSSLIVHEKGSLNRA